MFESKSFNKIIGLLLIFSTAGNIGAIITQDAMIWLRVILALATFFFSAYFLNKGFRKEEIIS